MRLRAIALLTALTACLHGLACAAGDEPVEEPVQERELAVPELPAPALPSSPELPPIREILYEYHIASNSWSDLHTAAASFPALTIYTDGSVLRADWSGSTAELRRARLSPTQLEELRALLLALEPFDRAVSSEPECPRPSNGLLEVRGTHCYVEFGHQIRVGEDDWICLTGCPTEPADMLATFIEIEDLLASIPELESTEWTPTRGHVAVLTNETTPGPLPWAASVQPEIPYAWVVEADDFAAAWDEAGRRTGVIFKDVDGWRYQISVVPWRPGEDLHEQVARYNRQIFNGDFLRVCDGMPTFPRSRSAQSQTE
jgi:hypothetical protein